MVKAAIPKKLKVLTLAKRKILMQKTNQLPKIRHPEIRRTGASQSLRQKHQQVKQSAMRLLQANQI